MQVDSINQYLRPGLFADAVKKLSHYLNLLKNRIFPSRSSQPDNLRYYQEFILQAILGSTVLLGFFALLPTLVVSFQEERWQLMAIDFAAFFTVSFLLFSRSLKYETRVVTTLSICYLLGLMIILKLGFLSGGTSWLFLFLVLTSLFLGIKAALIVLAVNGATLFITGWLIHISRLGPEFPFFRSLNGAMVSGINFLLLNAVAAVSIYIMVSGLREMARNEKVASLKLEQEKIQLIASQAQLNEEVSIRRKTETKLQAAHDELDLRVKDRTRQLAEKNEQLNREIADRKRAQEAAESANRAKSEFLANMSHELRTPPQSFIGFTELVADQKQGRLNDIQVEYLSDALTSSHHLLSLINDILDLAKVEAGKMDLEATDVDLREIFENGLSMIKEKALAHGIQLTSEVTDLPATIQADERKLKQIMYNLLSNAVKFTPDGGAIAIAAQACKFETKNNPVAKNSSCDGIKIAISDTGIGLNPDELERIFSPFEQAENSSSRMYQGTGLGLSLTRSLVDLHGGKIWAKSEGEGKGSTFKFIIPA